MATTRISEGIVTTLDADGSPNVAPMGPLVDESFATIVLRPYQTSRTYQNLKILGEGVFHVTDDVELFARAAIGRIEPMPEMRPAESVRGMVLADACRWYEFRVVSLDDSNERTEIRASVVAQGRNRDFFGFCRAKHAVLEAAILATRVGILPDEEIHAQMERLASPVEKTAGDQERQAFALLANYLHQRLGEDV